MTYKISLGDYTFNEKNSNKGEKQTRLDPGCPPEVALDIGSIYIEAKTSDLKKLKIGTVIEFNIDEEITLTVPNYKAKEDEEVSYYARGEGCGDIEDVELDDALDDDEYQEVRVVLRGGYGERL
jgi:hypothetical protein